MRSLLAVPLALLTLGLLSPRGTDAQERAPERYVEVRLSAPNPDALRAGLDAAGVQLDHAAWDRSGATLALRTLLSASELAALQGAAVGVEVLDADVAATYVGRAAASQARAGGCPTTPYPVTGTMGCYPTYDEVLAILDLMRTEHPDLITVRSSIGQTGEGRDLWMVELSDNPGVEEGEAEVLLTALHHAREPQGIVTVLHYLWDLLEGYGTDPEATYLLRSRRIYVVPMLNPDGYEYNRTTNPGGGGMWRKNRRNNGDGSFGVDINRNYGYQWGLDNSGSSPSPSSGTYRGPSAFSEPETRAVRDFLATRQVRTALNYHTFSDLLLWAWGYTPAPSPDEATFARYGGPMTSVNHYAAGPGYTTIYPTNGGSDDWMYGDQTTKPKIFAYTPEVGGDEDGFWPQPERILPLAEENLLMNYLITWYAGGRVEEDGGTYEETPGTPGANGWVDPGETFSVAYAMRNVGQAGTGPVTLTVTSANAALVPVSAGALGPVTLAPGESVGLESVLFRVAEGTPLGAVEGLRVVVGYENGASPIELALPAVTVGTPMALVSDDASSLAGWSSVGGWGLSTTVYASPSSSFADSPVGNYPGNANTSLTRTAPIDLSGVTNARLRFQTRWDTEPQYDAGQVLVSTNGTTWTPLAGRHTVPGSGQGVQNAGEPVYQGNHPNWVEEVVDLSAYVGQPAVRLRFALRSDGFTEDNGWFVDDIRVETLVNGATTAGEAGPEGAAFRLDAPAPNPSTAATTVGFSLDTAGPVVLVVYDALGRRVATLAEGDLAAGRHTATWDGAGVAPGVYVLRLASGARVATQRLTRLP